MQIDKTLRMVMPVQGEDGKAKAWVHSTAISAEVFDKYFLPISKTFAAIHGEGLGAISGPRVADKLLRKVSQDMGIWEDVKRGLVAEIERLSHVFMLGDAGWELVPLRDAKKQLDQEEAAEIEAALTFFTVGSAMYPRAVRRQTLDGALSLHGAQITSLSSTAFLESLTTSTEDASTGEKAAA